MSRARPIPPVEGMGAKIERGVGPLVQRAVPPPTAGTGEEQSATEAEGTAGPAAHGPVAAPDGTFTSAENPAAAELVPTAQPAAVMTGSAATDEQASEVPRQGAVYTMPAPDRPRAEDLLRPQPRMAREQISCMVPAELELVRRLRLFWAHEGVEQRDLVAIAIDRELRSRGY